MNTNSKIISGALCSLLCDDSIHKQTVLEIESTLGIDSSFPAAEELALQLHTCVSQIKPCPKQEQWLHALTEIKTGLLSVYGDTQEDEPLFISFESPGLYEYESLDEDWDAEEDEEFFRNMREVNLYSNMPRGRLEGHAEEYPLAAFFLQQTRMLYDPQTQIIHTLWLAALFKNAPSHELNQSSKLIQATLNLTVEERHALPMSITGLLHDIPWEDSHKFYEHLKTINESFNSVSEEIKDEGIAALGWLVGIVHEEKEDKLITPSLPPEVPAEPKITTYTGARQRSIEAQPITGEITVHKLNSPSSDDNAPPEFINLFSLTSEDPVSKNGEESLKEDIASESEIEQQVQESRYWLTRHEKIVPADYGRFTLAERMRVAQFINDGLNCSDINRALAAGLIGTIYVTGLPLEDLYQAGFGSNQTFMKGGIYRREIRLAQDAFSPSQTQINHISPFATELSFQLPEPVAKWLDSLSITSSTLSESLSIELDDARKLIHAELEVLRNNGCFQRIRAERIPAALAIETTLMFRDPLITFLLASKPTQAAPKLSYYVTHPVEKLSQYYEQVTNQMVNPWIN